ncbi:hypothetical protein Y1Q_0003809 [Alligator mississippiensis]|uniref:Uncharacterized protein n=1 Tax=Alligator mississippiensis TaxID=8496 RepID=A0A151MND2_ALLMI|nr:hypothetical protein Y1Q_0003809 [Alligator mississippiensis]
MGGEDALGEVPACSSLSISTINTCSSTIHGKPGSLLINYQHQARSSLLRGGSGIGICVCFQHWFGVLSAPDRPSL